MLKLPCIYPQLIRYAIIGCICSGLDFVIYYFLTKYLNVHYNIANIFSVHCGIFTSFFLNRHFNFRIKNKTAVRFFSFYIVGLLGLLVSTLLLILLIDKMLVDELISKAITIIIVALIQFILNKFITFGSGK